METRNGFPLVPLALAVLAACTDSGPTDVPDAPAALRAGDAAAAVVLSIPDMSGEWSWRRVESIRMPRWVVEEIVNAVPGNEVVPSGPNTFARCESGGAMTLTQSGRTFEGSLRRTYGHCETSDGQEYAGPNAGLPRGIADGEIHGMSLSFSAGNLVVTPCPMHAVIDEMEGGVAVAFSGGGRCVLPGHPQSGSVVQLDPPPGGTSTNSFEAWRD